MKLEVGKYYRTRDGRKVGPAEVNDASYTYPWNVPWPEGFYAYSDDGKSCIQQDQDDLIAEWRDGPARTVTVKKIEPGAYGRVLVGGKFMSKVSLELLGNALFAADELRATAATLTEIADALEGE